MFRRTIFIADEQLGPLNEDRHTSSTPVVQARPFANHRMLLARVERFRIALVARQDPVNLLSRDRLALVPITRTVQQRCLFAGFAPAYALIRDEETGMEGRVDG